MADIEKPAHPPGLKNMGQGRPKGVPNKYSRLKDAFFDAFHSNEMGGVEGLITWATLNNENRTHFYKFIVQLMPRDLHVGTGDTGPVPQKVIIEVKSAQLEEDETPTDDNIIEGQCVTTTELPDSKVAVLAHEFIESEAK